MKINDIKVIIDAMTLCGGTFDYVKIENGKVYSTNGGAMIIRDIEDTSTTGFLPKQDSPFLKGIYDTHKKDKELDYDISNLIINHVDNFPPIQIIEEKLDQEFLYEYKFNADLLIKAIKALKSKNNSIIFKLQENEKPALFVHENGKGLIVPIID